MSLRVLLLIPLAFVLALTVLVATEHQPSRVAPLTQPCPACSTAPLPWFWSPWPMPMLFPMPVQWQVG